jgi:hypothetical protein
MSTAAQEQLGRLVAARTDMLSGAVRKHVLAAARASDVADIDAWWARSGPTIVQLVRQGSLATAQLTAAYLTTHAQLAGLRITPVAYAALLEQVETSLYVTGPVSFKTHMRLSGSPASSAATMAKTMSASASRLVLAGNRGTISGAVKDGKIAGYRRVGDGRPCAFCAMLIGRGAVYSGQSADFHAHDGDGCRAEPLYEREPEPDHVQDLQQRFADATRGLSGADALRAWRGAWDTVATS